MIFRRAGKEDVPGIVALLADDMLGSQRERHETPLPDAYYEAFEAIAADPNHELLVAELDGEIVGTLQLSFLPGLSRQGMWRAQIEGVRISGGQRGKGSGAQFLRFAIARKGKRLPHGATHDRQETRGCGALLRTARIRA